MKKICFTLVSFLLLSYSFSQTCEISGEEDWEKVEVRLMNTREEKVNGFSPTGEAVITVSPKVKKMEDLSRDELEKIKKRVAKSKGCIVFVDMNGITDSDLFPTRSENKLYFYWFTLK